MNNINDLESGRTQSSDDTDSYRAKIALLRWRKAGHVVNACQRFLHIVVLANDRRRNHLLAGAIQVARPSEEYNQSSLVYGISDSSSRSANICDFEISSEELVSMSRENNFSLLQQHGGVKGVAEKLKSSLEKGLTQDETNLTNRKTTFGCNRYPTKKGVTLWRFIWEACQDITLIILMVAAVALIGFGTTAEGAEEGWYDGGGILLAVLIIIIFTAMSDYKQSLLLHDLQEDTEVIHMEVLRSGRRVEINIFDIVVGDVVPLKTGDRVPADGLLISGHTLYIDESSMTGESRLVHKDSSEPFLLSGCKVGDGYGTMLVTSVGLNTEWGLLMASISRDNHEDTPLQIRLNRVATDLGIVGIAVAITILVVLLTRFFAGHTKYPDIHFRAGKTKAADVIDCIIKIFAAAVAILVVAVPEGLAFAVTLTLAYSAKKMIADKALFRNLRQCETMGSATIICVDKSGTLTLNEMKVVEAYACGMKVFPDDSSALPPTVISLLIEGIANNTTGSVFEAEGGEALQVSGSPTEKAILRWGVNLGMNFDAVRSDSVVNVIHAFPFNSQKRQSGVALISRIQPMSKSEVRVHWKGAAEIVLASCTSYIDAHGCVALMGEDKLSLCKEAIEDMAMRSLRCVAIAYRGYEMNNVPTSTKGLRNWDLPETDLVLLAIVGIKDPCQPGVAAAVDACHTAGVKVVVVTGDSLQTARAVALECGIIGSDLDATEPNLIEGRTFRQLSEGERLEIADKILVMGSSSSLDKLLLVKALKKRGHIVAVTGHDTDDAPALYEANIGIALGLRGTQVAKDSSDVILLDDNFGSIVKVVKWGRSVYANIQKIIQFQCTVIVVFLVINIAGVFTSGNVPLNAVQLLWLNLVVDSLGALALGTMPPTDSLMYRPPISSRELLIPNILWRNVIVQTIYQVIVLLALSFNGRTILNLEQEPIPHTFKVINTLVFNSFFFCQIFNGFNARKPEEINVLKGVTKNHLFLGIVCITVALQIIIIEFLGKFTSTVHLSWNLWLASITIGFISWPLAAVGKLIPVPEKQLNIFLAKYMRRTRTRNHGENIPGRESAVRSGNIESRRTLDLESGTEIPLDEKAIANIISASGDKLSDEDAKTKASDIFLDYNANLYLYEYGFPTMGFPAILSRIDIHPDPHVTEKGNKCKQNYAIFSVCAQLLEFLSKAPIWSLNHHELDLPVSVQPVMSDENAAEASHVIVLNRESASEDTEPKGEGIEDKTFSE